MNRSAIALATVVIIALPALGFAAIDTDLKYGAQGAKVVELQNILIAQGYLGGSATGNFFALTRKAVIAYQKTQGLPTTGLVGPMTRAKLNAAKVEAGAASVTVATTSVTTETPKSPFDVKRIPFFVLIDIWQFSSSQAVQVPATSTPPAAAFMDASKLAERAIDPKTIVLVRCTFSGTYKSSGAKVPDDIVTTGTGVVVSPEGHILTAAHVMRIDDWVKDDISRTWKRVGCDVAPTDSKLTPIDAGNQTGTFVKADIVFEPTIQQYKPSRAEDPGVPGSILDLGGGADMDFAVLQAQSLHLPYTPIISKLLYLNPGEQLIGIGYPGVSIVAPQSLERIDTTFNGYAWQQDSSCVTKKEPIECGIRYQGKRYKADYIKLYDTPTPLGKHTSYFRGGFSGGPLFYKGYVVGIMITGKENPYSNLHDRSTLGYWNWVEALATSEIVATLKNSGVTLPIEQVQ